MRCAFGAMLALALSSSMAFAHAPAEVRYVVESGAPALIRVTELETSPLDRLLPYVGPEGGAGPDGVPAGVALYDEFNERMRIRNEVASLFIMRHQRDLAKLEAMLEGYRHNGELTGAGNSKLHIAYEHFNVALSTPLQTFEYALGTVEEWLRQFPSSISARIVRGSLLRNRATIAFASSFPRGAKDVPSPDRLVAEALAQLERDRDIASQDPLWHQLVMELKAESGASVAEILALVDAASRQFAKDPEIYKAAGRAVAAVSDDPARDVEAVAILAASRGESDAHYAGVYRSVVYGLGGLHTVKDLTIDWARLRKGMAELIERYPVQWNIQDFAAISCAGGDAATTRSLLGKVRGRPVRQAWQQLEFYDQCLQWSRAEPGAKPPQKAVDQ